ncbi:hypothetical protein AN958_01307 [Leucoagaricus sp. SymC.cos]|nr:hypothetical protein AN958_01307 [Leucoagaricus sp. SymC.cos]
METLPSFLGADDPVTSEREAGAPVAIIEDVLGDMKEMKAHGLALRDLVKEFPETGGTLIKALAIHNDTAKLQFLVNRTAQDVKNVPLPISVEDGKKVLDTTDDIKPLLAEAMKLVVEKKPAFENLHIGGILSIVRLDLTVLHDSVVVLEDALINASPPELSETVKEIKTQIGAIFEEVVAAYS